MTIWATFPPLMGVLPQSANPRSDSLVANRLLDSHNRFDRRCLDFVRAMAILTGGAKSKAYGLSR